jgi:hypothetical protein
MKQQQQVHTLMTQTGYNQRMHAQKGRGMRRRIDFSLGAARCGGVTVERGNKTMRSGTIEKPIKPVKPSVTDKILNFCASGRFGVREAIAAVTTPKEKMKKHPPQQRDLQQQE